MALNVIAVMGRITHDLELKETPKRVPVCSFAIAVDKGKDKEPNFFDCVAWKSNAEFITKYFSKGRLIAIEGELNSRQWTDRDENKRKTTEIIVKSASFCGDGKKASNLESQENTISNIEDLPF